MATIILTGSCGDNATFNLYDDGLLEILGTGAMTDCKSTTLVPWGDNRTQIKQVTIADGITKIGYYAFRDCTELTSITIPDSVTKIGYYAFQTCTGLTSITIPNSVTNIGGYAFYGCTGLTSITIPDSVTSIGYSAFEDCTGLTSITIPNGVTSIKSYTFFGCTGFKSVTIPDSVTSIGISAFQSCKGLTSVTIPSSVTWIGTYAFGSCANLTRVTLKGQPPTMPYTTVFDYTPIKNGTGRINVPRQYLSDYTSDTNWGVFKAAIHGVESLAELFKEIADSIRAKKSTTATICPYDYATEIESISGGGGVPDSFATVEF